MGTQHGDDGAAWHVAKHGTALQASPLLPEGCSITSPAQRWGAEEHRAAETCLGGPWLEWGGDSTGLQAAPKGRERKAGTGHHGCSGKKDVDEKAPDPEDAGSSVKLLGTRKRKCCLP